MNVNPRQNDPEFQDPNAADSERQSQFGMQSQADMPLAAGATGMGTSNAPTWGQRDVIASAPVFGSDDKKIGTVQESYTDSFKVKSGFLITHDHYFPYSAIARSDPERIVLNITSDQAKHEQWQQRPVTDAATGMGTIAGGMAAGAATEPAATEPAATTPQATGTTGEYGVYGPEGPQDTMQAATERGAHPDAAPAGPMETAVPGAPATPGAGRLPSGADTATPGNIAAPVDPMLGSTQGPTPAPMQGDMAYRGTMGPNNQPGLPDRPYNPGLQGTDAAGQQNAGGPLQPEQDPTSWNQDPQQPNTGV